MNQTPADGLEALRKVLPANAIETAAGVRWAYSGDNSKRQSQPLAVVFPQSTDDVVRIVRTCRDVSIPIVARGLGSATTGAAVPATDGIVVSFERMNRLLAIDSANRVAVVQPGMTNQVLQDALAEHGFFWPPDPTSAAYSTVGGNLACNAAGPRAVKYGTCRDNTLGLVAITGSGDIIRCGCYTTKGVVGYDLTRLIIGSEGTLAIIAEATLKLTPLPAGKRTLRAVYKTTASAAQAVSRIMAQPVVPCALEYMDHNALDVLRSGGSVTIDDDAAGMLLVEIDGDKAALDIGAHAIGKASADDDLIAFESAASAADAASLWAARKALSPALRTIAPNKINEDVVVPVSKIPELIERLDALSHEHEIRIVSFGHAGNGNLHVNLLTDADDEAQRARNEACLADVFSAVLSLGGTLSGEHGIGLVKRNYVPLEIEPAALELMRAIKRQFDPTGILNPGKIFPD